MELLHNPIRPYAWGSRVTIARTQGRPVPSDRPEAELWMGAHPDDPSEVVRAGDRRSLAELISSDPDDMLGRPVLERFGPRLPFLLKLLAAEQPLSLQAHPDAARARQAYAAQAALPPDSPDRLYRDPHHKPELLVAVEPFRALCGFRDPAVSRAAFAMLHVPTLEPVVAALSGVDPGRALREAITALLTWPHTDRANLMDLVVKTLRSPASAVPPERRPDRDLVLELAAAYPGDVGALVALLLNPVRLEPGEGIWMPAGNLHAYLRGTGVEVMAASDNVLRGGLTPKRVDVPELLRVLRYEVLTDPVVRPLDVAAGVVTWPTPAEEFLLHRAEVPADGPVRLPGYGPRVVFCWSGRTTLADVHGDRCDLERGGAAFVPPGAGELTCTGKATVFQAAVG